MGKAQTANLQDILEHREELQEPASQPKGPSEAGGKSPQPLELSSDLIRHA
jgi:hypothetical protein